MGGRGSVSSLNSGTPYDQFKKNGVLIHEEDLKGLNMTLVNKTLKGMQDTLKEFGLPISTIHGIGIAMAKDAQASVNGFRDLNFGRKSYSQKENEFKKRDDLADSTAYGTGTHEAGHAIVDYAMHKHNQGKSVLELSNLRRSRKFDREILKKAKKINGGHLNAISKYGSSSRGKASAELIAEGVSEYMRKKGKASASSKAIVKALKTYL